MEQITQDELDLEEPNESTNRHLAGDSYHHDHVHLDEEATHLQNEVITLNKIKYDDTEADINYQDDPIKLQSEPYHLVLDENDINNKYIDEKLEDMASFTSSAASKEVGTQELKSPTSNKYGIDAGKRDVPDITREDERKQYNEFKSDLPATKSYKDSGKLTATPTENNGPQSVLTAIPRGQAKVQQIVSSITQAKKRMDEHPIVKPALHRIPPKLVRQATANNHSPRSSMAKGPSLYYEEPRRPLKVISWDEATNTRPPLRIDMEGPGPWSYSPTNKPLNESNAPAYTFGSKCYPEKVGGARTSWAKSWFQSNHSWHIKADFHREGHWPTPNQYHKGSLMGPRQRTMPEAPAFTFGHKFQLSSPRSGHVDPSPSDYQREMADRLVLKTGPSFTHQFRRDGTILWGSCEPSPGPAAYYPTIRPRTQNPAYTIQGIRREKSQMLGPFSTI
ncbi:unnamed protein product [Lymnaea stagnalis]|uniref:Uncharacterized protein n=1 Tax=Lymnaea stagnalis TaxID=6523 RepID=A0AAV2GYG6_LYMST